MYSRTSPKKSSPSLGKSCKRAGFGMRLSERNFPFIIGECFACQHGVTANAFRCSALEEFISWAPFLPAEDNRL